MKKVKMGKFDFMVTNAIRPDSFASANSLGVAFVKGNNMLYIPMEKIEKLCIKLKESQ